ncbi:DUF982 domain-containing protein [Rhizobium sp. Root1220]|uniref:DUF982 domain-containing protein n=1 Tax=Rhizobium sp. Root1220 TaxID=1736432 RepID=UPI000AA1B2A6|nr:DUF982 domain-containing protein [Rhizobium sp. Root1220]
MAVLIYDWPVTEGRAYFCALEVCTAVDDGQRTPDEAQTAFVAAAMAAKLELELPSIGATEFASANDRFNRR